MNYKKYLNAFLSIGSSMTAIKMETSAMNMWSEIMICIKLKLLRKGFYGDAASSQLSSGMNQI